MMPYEDPSQTQAEAGLTDPSVTGTTQPPLPSYLGAPTGAPSAVSGSGLPWLDSNYMGAATGNIAVPGGAPTSSQIVSGQTLYVGVDRSYSYNPHDVNSLSAGRNQAPVKQVTTKTLVPGSIDEAKASILTMSADQLKALQKKFGVKATGLPDQATVAVVDQFLGYVSDINASGVEKTWEQMLNQLTQNGKKPLLKQDSSQPFTGSKTTTHDQVQLYSPSQLRGSAEDAFTAAIGRAPTKQERILLHNAVNNHARANPVVSTTTTDYNKGEQTASHTVTDGGIDPNQIIENEARSQQGYGEYQAINYFDTMMSMLGAVGGA